MRNQPSSESALIIAMLFWLVAHHLTGPEHTVALLASGTFSLVSFIRVVREWFS